MFEHTVFGMFQHTVFGMFCFRHFSQKSRRPLIGRDKHTDFGMFEHTVFGMFCCYTDSQEVTMEFLTLLSTYIIKFHLLLTEAKTIEPQH